MKALSLLLLFIWLAFEINHKDMAAPEPDDPYRLERWKNGEKNLDS